jgi:hypothetical protein
MKGMGITPFGGALYPFGGMEGGALYPFGGAIGPMGSGLRPFGKSMPYRENLGKVYAMPTRFQMYGGGILSGIKSGLVRVGKAALKKAGSTAKSAAKELGKMALDEGTKLATSKITDAKRIASVKANRLPASMRGPAKKAIGAIADSAKSSVAGLAGGGTASELNPLKSGQIRTIERAAAMGLEKAPALDRHEITFARNIVQGKRIAGRGLKKM